MTLTPDNRMAIGRRRGRPTTDDQRPPATEALPVLLATVVPPLSCPCCGRGMQPRVIRTRPDGTRDCTCSLCGRGFTYSPPRVRPT